MTSRKDFEWSLSQLFYTLAEALVSVDAIGSLGMTPL